MFAALQLTLHPKNLDAATGLSAQISPRNLLSKDSPPVGVALALRLEYSRPPCRQMYLVCLSDTSLPCADGGRSLPLAVTFAESVSPQQ